MTDWVTYTDQEKVEVIQRLDQQLLAATANLFTIEDQERLAEQIKKYNLRCDFTRAPVYWLLCLLREGKDQIKDLSQYGLKLNTELTPAALFDQLDEASYQLAKA